ncbi:MAG TPA: hypothetical protein VI138_03715 [Candidatus Dormibacteraeota bacterium]
MRIPFGRLAIAGGGAVILATAGFAYMASNSVPVSSAGEASAAVTGYAATDIQYSAEQGWGQPAPLYSVSTVKFILTSDANSAPGNGQPAQVEAALENTSGTWVNFSCSVSTPWTIGVSGQGSAGVVCNESTGGPVLVASLGGLDVEANQ